MQRRNRALEDASSFWNSFSRNSFIEMEWPSASNAKLIFFSMIDFISTHSCKLFVECLLHFHRIMSIFIWIQCNEYHLPNGGVFLSFVLPKWIISRCEWVLIALFLHRLNIECIFPNISIDFISTCKLINERKLNLYLSRIALFSKLQANWNV